MNYSVNNVLLNLFFSSEIDINRINNLSENELNELEVFLKAGIESAKNSLENIRLSCSNKELEPHFITNLNNAKKMLVFLDKCKPTPRSSLIKT